MKILLISLFVLVPFIWSYIKNFSQKNTAKMKVYLHIDRLYNYIISGQDIEALEELISFTREADQNPDLYYYFSKLPFDRKKLTCLSYVNELFKIYNQEKNITNDNSNAEILMKMHTGYNTK
jgi:hypothetical protein